MGALGAEIAFGPEIRRFRYPTGSTLRALGRAGTSAAFLRDASASGRCVLISVFCVLLWHGAACRWLTLTRHCATSRRPVLTRHGAASRRSTLTWYNATCGWRCLLRQGATCRWSVLSWNLPAQSRLTNAWRSTRA